MKNEYQISQVISDEQIVQILQLQRDNLKRSLTPESIVKEGFVTCEHDHSLLKKMNTPNPHVIALYDDSVVGYCLVMAPKWRDELEVIRMMFDKIESNLWNGTMICSDHYITMGQVCIHKDHRSKGLFKKMYHYYRERMSDQFEYCITEVAADNHRSLNAHAAVGFEKFQSYVANDGKNWELIIWDWKK